MSKFRQLVQIRAKKMGLLILDARTARRRSQEECAKVMGISTPEFQSYENGLTSPGLPQLELLALYLDVPLEHFWARQDLLESDGSRTVSEPGKLVSLRNRMIGTNLRQARNTANFSYQEITERGGISEEDLRKVELGEVSIPLAELEVLSLILDVPIESFYDQHGPIGRWRKQKGNVQRFLDLPPEIQEFVCKPVNRPYLELAIRLSELNAEKLRGVAETLLEITY